MANKQYPHSRSHSASVRFNQPLGYTPEQTITGALTLTADDTDAQVGYGEIRRYVANGVNEPDLSAFALEGPGSWDNTNGAVNKLFFYFDGEQFCVVITQPGTGGSGGGGGGDVTAPTLVSAANSNGSPNTITLTYNEALDTGSEPATGDYLVKVNTINRTTTGVNVTGSTVVIDFSGATIVEADSITIDYTPGSNPVQDVAGNDAAALSGQAVTNNVVGYDSDAEAFFTAASITDDTQKTAVNQLVLDLKAAGVWTKSKVIYPFVGGTTGTHKYNLKNPLDTDGAFRITFTVC